MARRSQSAEATVSLFPFLAVLLCTMGALTMIFVAIAHEGADGPDEPASVAENEVDFDAETGLGDIAQYGTVIDAEALEAQLNRNQLGTADRADDSDDAYERALIATDAMTLEDVVGEKESIDWFVDEILAIRERTESDFEEQRSRLAAAEASLARLRADLEVSKRKYETLAQENVAQGDETAVSLQDRINVLDVDIEQLKTEIEELREKNKDAKRSYAIVPYQGKEGTFRRPIYIECTESGVYLQPEGVRFDERDFLVAKYPGNPFDSALRAASRHYLETTGSKTASGDSVEPYPLLIVRSGGSKYFYAAVEALASWGGVYGYEFVDDDQTLAYPEPDPTLKRLASEQADLSRARLAIQLEQALAAQRAMSRELAFNSRGRGGSGSDGGAYPGGGSSELQSRLGSNVRIGAAKPDVNMLSGQSYSPSNTAALSGQVYGANPNVGDGYGRGRLDIDSYAPLPAYSGAFSYAVVDPRTLARPSGSSSDSGTGGSPNPSDNATGAHASDAVLEAGRQGGGFESGAGTQTTASSGSLGSPTGQAGQADAQRQTAQSQYVGNAAATGTSPSASAPGFMANMIANDGARAENGATVDVSKTLGNTTYAQGATGTSSVGELANRRSLDSEEGADDALTKINNMASQDQPQAIRLSQERPATSAIERGVLVRCEQNAIVFPKQPGVRNATTISYRDGSNASEREQELLDAFTFCVKSWGVAGRNAYWAPYVKADVAEGGEERFRELAAFCQKQGLSIVRVKPNEVAK